MKFKTICTLFAISLNAPAAFADSESGPVGGAGGGEFRTACEPGDHIVGFDFGYKRDVIVQLAPVCGKKGGTYGRPWAGEPRNSITINKPRCPGLGMVTAIVVSIDKTPLVSGLEFTCWNPYTGDVSEGGIVPAGTTVNARRMACGDGEIADGVFGRAGTAIDALGLTCATWQGP